MGGRANILEKSKNEKNIFNPLPSWRGRRERVDFLCQRHFFIRRAHSLQRHLRLIHYNDKCGASTSSSPLDFNMADKASQQLMLKLLFDLPPPPLGGVWGGVKEFLWNILKIYGIGTKEKKIMVKIAVHLCCCHLTSWRATLVPIMEETLWLPIDHLNDNRLQCRHPCQCNLQVN